MTLLQRLVNWLFEFEPEPNDDDFPDLSHEIRAEVIDGQLIVDVKTGQIIRQMAAVRGISADDMADELVNAMIFEQHHQARMVEIWDSLSLRQKQVTALACLGYTISQMSKRLGITAGTVRTHLRITYKKFDVPNKHNLSRALYDWNFTGWDQTDSVEDLPPPFML